VGATAYTMDIDDQGLYAQNNPDAQNYGYDKIGNLIKDKAEEIAQITWNVQGKVTGIIRASNSTKPNLFFKYDALGNRVSKAVINKTTTVPDTVTTYYVRDATGNVMAVYEKSAGVLALQEQYMYGSARLGVFHPSGGGKSYELTNHLGNVLAVVSDTKNADGTAKVVNATDYDPFGMEMPGRVYQTGEYRFGFTGHEKDDEIKGAGNSYTTEFRFYDPRIGRWNSIDIIQLAAQIWMV
jgi:RHS repeat-associated protein